MVQGAIGVQGGQIRHVVRSSDHGLDAVVRIDAKDVVVCLAFIDAHSHSDLRLFAKPTLAPKKR